MMDDNFPKNSLKAIRKGDPIFAEWLNDIIDAIAAATSTERLTKRKVFETKETAERKRCPFEVYGVSYDSVTGQLKFSVNEGTLFGSGQNPFDCKKVQTQKYAKAADPGKIVDIYLAFVVASKIIFHEIERSERGYHEDLSVGIVEKGTGAQIIMRTEGEEPSEEEKELTEILIAKIELVEENGNVVPAVDQILITDFFFSATTSSEGVPGSTPKPPPEEESEDEK